MYWWGKKFPGFNDVETNEGTGLSIVMNICEFSEKERRDHYGYENNNNSITFQITTVKNGQIHNEQWKI